MDRMVKGPRNGWQRVTACALVLALVVQGIAFTLAGTRLAADPTDAATSFELCRHDSGMGGGSAPHSPAADSHCIFCLTGTTYLDAPPAAADCHTITFGVLSWSLGAWLLPAATVNVSARPRGPPLPA